MAKQVLNVGAKNNDKTGDTLRAGGLKIKANFEELYAALATDGSNISGGDVLKTGSYLDLNDRPSFANVAISGNFYDLQERPDIGIFVGEPPNSAGVEGHVAGNMAFNADYLFVCMSDYIQQDSYTNFVFQHEEDYVDFSVQAKYSSNDGTVAIYPPNQPGQEPPQVDWRIHNGTTNINITQVSEEVDEANHIYYLLTVDGSINVVADEWYEVSFAAPEGSYVFCCQWKSEYQSLLDAHDVGQGAHLFVTYDGYGRKVTQIIHDSIENEITIVYEAGSKIADYTGIRIDLDQPSIWKRVQWDTNW